MSLRDAKQHQILGELYIRACGDLLSTFGLDVEIEERSVGATERRGDSYVSILGATGDSIRLSSTLKIDHDLVLSTHPLSGASISHDGLADWCRELNNQLIGRMKNKLLSYDQVLTVGLPMLITGTDVNPVVAPDSQVREYCIRAAQSQITLNLSTLVAQDLDLQPMSPECDAEPAMLEGAIALF